MGKNRIVIVADDDESIRECIGGVLCDEGFDVRLARDGREALELLSVLGDARCVLLLDLMMPVLSGFDVLRLLSRAGRLPGLPVIVCSAMKEHEPMPAGVRHVLRKPVLLDSLLVTIEGACGGPASAVHLCARYELGESGDLPARRAAS